MSATDTSYVLTNGGRFNTENSAGQNPKPNKVSVPVYRTLDIDSTYRDRYNYPNPNNFVIPTQYPGRGSTAFTAVDPVIGAVPYTGSETKVPNELVTGTSYSSSNITLDPSEPNIDNFYINSILQIGSAFSTIVGYTGASQSAIITPAFGSNPSPGTIYYTRHQLPVWYGTVSTAVVSSTTTSFGLDTSASSVNNAYVNSYIVAITGPNSGEFSLITAYTGATRTVILQTPLSVAPTNGSIIEIDNLSSDNARALDFSPNVVGSGSQVSYYEIELLWLSFPNQIFNVSYGGIISDYPYCYVSLYNEGSNSANQVLYSNNPFSSKVLFKVPVNQYYGSTQFVTLKDSKSKQVVPYSPDKDLRFIVTLPDGSIAQFAEADNMAPLAPNPLQQVNASFAIRRVS